MKKLKERLKMLMEARERKSKEYGDKGAYSEALNCSTWATCIDYILIMIDEIEKEQLTPTKERKEG